MFDVTKYFIYYTIFSFFGYIAEVIYVAICTKKITNRGYLYGPLVPIYGYGSLLIMLSTTWAYNLHGWYSPILVFAIGFLVTSALEYATSFVMELIFHMRWWDYSDKIGNINGRVCLRNSTMFGCGALAVMYLAKPFILVNVDKLFDMMGLTWFYIIAGLIFTAQVVDTILSTIKHVNVSKLIRKLEALAKEVSHEIKDKTKELKDDVSEATAKIKENMSEQALKLKTYLSDTKIAKKLSSIQIQYPSMRIKDRSEKTRIRISEFINKIKESLK